MRLVVAAAATVVVVLGVLYVINAPPANEEERKRCVFDKRTAASFKYRDELRARYPSMSAESLDRMAYREYDMMQRQAEQECAAKFGP